MGSGKSGSKYPVVKYYLSMMWGICATGRNIELLELKFGDKVAWRGSRKMNGEIEIDKPDLFGGEMGDALLVDVGPQVGMGGRLPGQQARGQRPGDPTARRNAQKSGGTHGAQAAQSL